MAESFVVNSDNEGTATGAGTTVSTTNRAAYSAGDLLIAVGTHDLTTNATGDVASVTDSAGNLWSQGCHIKTAGFGVFVIYWAVAKAGAAANANTVTLNLTLQNDRDIIFGAYTGFVHQPLLVAHNTATGNSATASASITNNYASNALVVAGAGVATGVTGVGGGATNRRTDAFGDNLEDIIGAATGTVTPTATLTSGLWNFGVLLFVPAPYGYESDNNDSLPQKPRPRIAPMESQSVLPRLVAAALKPIFEGNDPVPPPPRRQPPMRQFEEWSVPDRSVTTRGSVGWMEEVRQVQPRPTPIVESAAGGGNPTIGALPWLSDEFAARPRYAPRMVEEMGVFSGTKPLPSLAHLQDDVGVRTYRPRPTNDDRPFDAVATLALAGIGWSHQDPYAPRRMSPAPEQAQTSQTDTKPLLPAAPFQDDVGVKSYRPPVQPQEWLAYDPTKPLPPLAYLQDEVGVRASRPKGAEADQVSKAAAVAALLAGGWAPEDPNPRRKPSLPLEDRRGSSVSVNLASVAWGHQDPYAPRRVAPAPEPTAVFQARAQASLSTSVGDEPSPRRLPARQAGDDWALKLVPTVLLPSTGHLTDDTVHLRPRVWPPIDDSPMRDATIVVLLSGAFLQDDSVHPRARVWPAIDDPPADKRFVPASSTGGWLFEDSARGPARRPASVREFFPGAAREAFSSWGGEEAARRPAGRAVPAHDAWLGLQLLTPSSALIAEEPPVVRHLATVFRHLDDMLQNVTPTPSFSIQAVLQHDVEPRRFRLPPAPDDFLPRAQVLQHPSFAWAAEDARSFKRAPIPEDLVSLPPAAPITVKAGWLVEEPAPPIPRRAPAFCDEPWLPKPASLTPRSAGWYVDDVNPPAARPRRLADELGSKGATPFGVPGWLHGDVQPAPARRRPSEDFTPLASKASQQGMLSWQPDEPAQPRRRPTPAEDAVAGQSSFLRPMLVDEHAPRPRTPRAPALPEDWLLRTRQLEAPLPIGWQGEDPAPARRRAPPVPEELATPAMLRALGWLPDDYAPRPPPRPPPPARAEEVVPLPKLVQLPSFGWISDDTWVRPPPRRRPSDAVPFDVALPPPPVPKILVVPIASLRQFQPVTVVYVPPG